MLQGDDSAARAGAMIALPAAGSVMNLASGLGASFQRRENSCHGVNSGRLPRFDSGAVICLMRCERLNPIDLAREFPHGHHSIIETLPP